MMKFQTVVGFEFKKKSKNTVVMKYLNLLLISLLILSSCKKEKDDDNGGGVKDLTPPVVTINSRNPDTIPLFAQIIELPHVTAIDAVDGTVPVSSDWSSTNP